MQVTPLDDLRALVGKDIGVSSWMMVDQRRINMFADATDDHQFIHVDLERAKQTPLGGTVAHGFLTLSMVPVMAAEVVPSPEGTKMMLNYGLEQLRFLNPVRSGKRIRGQFRMLSFSERKPGQWLQRLGVTVEIEGEERPAMSAEWLALFFV